MSGKRLLAVLGLDAGHNARRGIVLVWILLLALFAWGFATGGAQIRAGDSQVGGKKALITSQFAVAQQLAVLGLLAYGFFVAVIAGMSPVRDSELRVGELLHATPLRPREYVWGKFGACLLTFAAVVGLHLVAIVFFNHIVPGGAESAELRGPFAAGNYLVPAVVFLAPLVLFLAGTSYATGLATRSPILVFVLPVALLLACAFFVWTWTPGWLDPRINRALMLVDPAGFRWLLETWLKVDRGVAFYNTSPIPFDTPFLLSRLAFALGGIGAVVLAERRLARSLRGERVSQRKLEGLQAAEPGSGVPMPVATRDRPLAALGMRSRRPGLLAGAWRVARAELRELRASPGLYLFVPLILLQTIGVSTTAVGPFDTPLLSTPGTLAVAAMAPLSIMVCLLLLFYTVESVLRERHVGLDAIAHATPLRTASLLLGKVAASAVVGVAILLATLLADLIVLAFQRTVPFEWLPYALVWGLLLVPTFLLWTSFVAALLALTRNRYATYALGLAVLAFSGYRFVRGEMDWLGNWPLWQAVRWSDMSVLEFDRRALVLNRAWVLGLAAVFLALTALWFTRRDRDPARLMHRLRPRALLRSGLLLAPVVIPTLALGWVLGYQIDHGPQGDSTKKRAKDYWKQNLATWKDYPLPTLEAVDLDLDLEPARSSFRMQGEYRLVNRTAKPLRQVPVTAGFHWNAIAWTWDGAAAKPDERTRLYVFTPAKPLGPGESARLGFSYTGRFPMGITKNGGGSMEFILPSGVVLTSFSTSFVPALGYVEDVGVDKENSYEARRYPADFFEGRTDPAFGTGASMTTRLKITAPSDFTVNSVGMQIDSHEADGRRTVVWQSDEPVHFFNVVAGRWAVKRGKDTAVYYHPAHPYNVEDLSAALDAAREYYSQWFYEYPWKELKLSEFPNLASYAQGFPTNITFSEGVGFLTDANDKHDLAFLVAAHEAAHQWWGNLLLPGKGPGGNILAEGMANFSTALLMEQVKGPRARIEYLKGIERLYTEKRKVDEERPLVLTDNTLPTDGTVTYDRGGWVFWMLMQHLGREKMFAGLHQFIDRYRVTDDFPVLQDFLATMRPFATDPDAFDAFARQWVFGKALPEFQLSDARKAASGAAWDVTATLTNAGTGTVRVSVAAERGEQFDKAGQPNDEYRSEATPIDLGPGESRSVKIPCSFDPERLVVDPDVQVLQLFRDRARASL